MDSIKALNITPAMYGRWIHTDSHLWYSTEDGEIDEWRWDVEFHNGPMCQICGYAPCIHCNPNYQEEKCPVGHYVCSECAEPSIDGHEESCPACGIKMDLKKR